ncbi:MAG: Uma2 family endonuclease [Rhodoferax sp.]|jgi:Uma2 family endonuclease|nr:Uma2 family endonuclease [Rhodoferax sp.]
MGLPQAIHQMTAQEFSDWELDQPERHEFFRGEVFRVFGLGGARREHVRVTMNIARSLDNHLAGTPCQAFMADMKVHVEATGDMFYPDILVTYDPRDLCASLEMQHPKLIIEALALSLKITHRIEQLGKVVNDVVGRCIFSLLLHVA